MKLRFLATGFGAMALAMVATPASAQCVGNCGINAAPDGDVTASPGGTNHSFVTTANGVGGVGLGLGNEVNGSVFTTPTFSAQAGDDLRFYFNYVTSDGEGFADYAWVQLLGGGSTITLFTARTTDGGDTVPGFGLPAIAPGVTLTPAATPIQPGSGDEDFITGFSNGPVWSALGESSGRCYEIGCGLTGWIEMTYEITTAGNYRLRFGVVNWDDPFFQSGLAWNGAVIGGNPIPEIPEPGTWAMLIAGFGLVGLAARRRRMALAA